MPTYRRLPCLVICLAFVAAALAGGQQRLLAPSAQPDLPPGAVLRLGSARFRSSSPINAVAFFPDGKTLATLTYPGRVCCWDACSGLRLREFPVRTLATENRNMALSPDGQLLATGGEDKAVYLYAAADGKQLCRLSGHQLPVFALSFSPDGKVLATSDMGENTLFWDVVRGKLLRRLDRHAIGQAAQPFSPDAKQVALVKRGDNKVLRLFDVATGKELRQLVDPAGETFGIASFSPDGKYLAVRGASRGTVRLVEVASGRTQWRTEQHEVEAGGLLFAPDGRSLASVHPRGTDIYLWDAATGKARARLPGANFAFSPDSKTLVTGGTDGNLRLWEVPTGKERYERVGHLGVVRNFALSPDGATLATAGDDGGVLLWDTATGRPCGGLTGLDAKPSPFWSPGRCLAFSPDGKRLAVGLRVWDVATRRVVRDFKVPHFWLHSVMCCGFSADGKRFAAGIFQPGMTGSGRDGRMGLVVWEAESAKAVLSVEQQAIWVAHMAMSPDAGTLAWGHSDGTVRLLPAVEQPAADQIPFVPGGLSSLAFSGDGTLLVSARKGALTVQDVASRRKSTLPGACDPGALLAVAPNALLLAEATPAGEVRVWELATASVIARFKAHNEAITCMTFSRDGRRLFTGSVDSTVVVWDVRHALGRRSTPPKEPRPALQRLWESLADRDATVAYRALWALAATPERTVPFLKEQLRTTSPAAVRQFLADLDSPKFAVREAATRNAKQFGPEIEVVLRQELARGSLERRRRLELILAELQKAPLGMELLRRLRAVVLLEEIGTQEARAVLATLPEGGPRLRTTLAVEAALRRLHPPAVAP